ncbi:hypothetical protein G5B42_04190 [Hydrogenispora sp. UU3]|uniref:Uncharacterized protein n=1 Tax=Capillibacterium thermochitinicola TaxID=2699427 RepID=A0A8J6I0I7_9FIRM|nr:hypothetical protein [Capillibacterium thermochitinicola]MBA2132743.1 hypothetical protein [Capillibacterium thermochitinicola]
MAMVDEPQFAQLQSATYKKKDQAEKVGKTGTNQLVQANDHKKQGPPSTKRQNKRGNPKVVHEKEKTKKNQ